MADNNDSLSRAGLELDKLRLEVEDLRSRSRLHWKLLTIIVPSLIPLIFSAFALYVSWSTQVQQVKLTGEQTRLQKENYEYQRGVKQRELLNAVVLLATEHETSRRIAGILTLAEFWREEADEYTVATSLSGALISNGKDDRAIRCAAADAIGKAYVQPEAFRDQHPEARVLRLAHLLYGTGSGDMGIVVRQNLFLKDTGHDRSSSTLCRTELDATREAIRENWEYLVDVNLKDTDLDQIQLYRADLRSTTFARASLREADLACANLEETDFSKSGWNAIGRIEHANVHGARPLEFHQWALAHGALDMTDSLWLDWRKGGFRLSLDGKPVSSSTPETPQDRYCGAVVESN